MRLKFLDQHYFVSDTTRRYPRSLQEAFPMDYAEAIHHHQPSPLSWLLADIAVAVIMVGVIVGLIFGVI